MLSLFSKKIFTQSTRILKNDWFSLVEIIVVIALISILTVIGITYGNNYKLSQYNVRRIDDIKTLTSAMESYTLAKKTMPESLWNTRFYNTVWNYVHDANGAFWASSFVTPDTFPREYLNTFPLDPQTNHYYAYGRRYDNVIGYEFATILNDGWEYSTYLRGNYDGSVLASLIKEAQWPNFVDDGTVKYLPYNPEELKLTGRIYFMSGSVQIDTGNSIWKDIDIKNPIWQWDKIKVVQWWNTTIYLSDGSEMEVGSKASDTIIDFNTLKYKDDNNLSSQVESVLTLWEVWVRAPKYYKSSDFSIQSDGQVATVRGTVFWTKNDGHGNRNFQLANGKLLIQNKKNTQLPSIPTGSGYTYDMTLSGAYMEVAPWEAGLNLEMSWNCDIENRVTFVVPSFSPIIPLTFADTLGSGTPYIIISTEVTLTGSFDSTTKKVTLTFKRPDSASTLLKILKSSTDGSNSTIYSSDNALSSSYIDNNPSDGNNSYQACLVMSPNYYHCSHPITISIPPKIPQLTEWKDINWNGVSASDSETIEIPQDPCNDTFTATGADTIIQEKMKEVVTRDIWVNSGRIPQITDITKTSTGFSLTVNNFWANEIEITSLTSDPTWWTPNPIITTWSTLSGTLTYTWNLISWISSLSLQLCYNPDLEATSGKSGDRICSATKIIDIPHTWAIFSFTGSNIIPPQDTTNPTKCNLGQVRWNNNICQNENLIAYANYNKPRDIFLYKRDGSRLPIAHSANIISSGTLLWGLPDQVEESIWADVSYAGANCNPEFSGATLVFQGSCSTSTKDYSRIKATYDTVNSFFKFDNWNSGIFINNSPSQSGSLTYDLSPIANKLKDGFTIEIGVRWVALTRSGNDYKLFDNGDFMIGINSLGYLQVASNNQLFISNKTCNPNGGVSSQRMYCFSIPSIMNIDLEWDYSIIFSRNQALDTNLQIKYLNKTINLPLNSTITTKLPLLYTKIVIWGKIDTSSQNIIQQWNDIIEYTKIYATE